MWWGIILKLSIIIPVYNDETSLSSLLMFLVKHKSSAIEIIVVDGNSSDSSIYVARKYADYVLSTDTGRAKQMNAGAKIAKGEKLWFLHADSYFTKNPINVLIKINSLWGHFKVNLDAPGMGFRIIESMMNWRSCITDIATGDQAIFISRTLFNEKQGFDDIELMEDIALSKKLKPIKPLCLNDVVITSARKWQNNGLFKTMLLMWFLRLRYSFGTDPKKLKQQYYP